MTFESFVKQIAKQEKITLPEARRRILQITDAITMSGGIRIPQFGTFLVRVRKARVAKIPRSMPEVENRDSLPVAYYLKEIPPKWHLAFRPAKNVKGYLQNNGRSLTNDPDIRG